MDIMGVKQTPLSPLYFKNISKSTIDIRIAKSQPSRKDPKDEKLLIACKNFVEHPNRLGTTMSIFDPVNQI